MINPLSFGTQIQANAQEQLIQDHKFVLLFLEKRKNN